MRFDVWSEGFWSVLASEEALSRALVVVVEKLGRSLERASLLTPMPSISFSGYLMWRMINMHDFFGEKIFHPIELSPFSPQSHFRRLCD